jgi:hypothetical protein
MHYGVWERFDWILKIFLDVAFADRLFFCAGGLGPVFWVWLFIRSSSTWGMTGFCRQWLGIRERPFFVLNFIWEIQYYITKFSIDRPTP